MYHLNIIPAFTDVITQDQKSLKFYIPKSAIQNPQSRVGLALTLQGLDIGG
jgi:hypothetical protein